MAQPASKRPRTRFSLQSLLEKFVEKLDPADLKCYKKENGEFRPVAEWGGFEFNDDGELEGVCISTQSLKDPLRNAVEVQYLPSTVRKLTLQCEIQSIGDWIRLPSSLEHLDVRFNRLSGELDFFKKLPKSLVELNLSGNVFSGHLDFTGLPPGLKTLDLSHNSLSGPLCFTSLPSHIQVLHLGGNNFSHPLDFSGIPRSLRVLGLDDTRIGSELTISKVPKESLSLRSSNINGTVKFGLINSRQGGTWRYEINLQGNTFEELSFEEVPNGDIFVHVPIGMSMERDSRGKLMFRQRMREVNLRHQSAIWTQNVRYIPPRRLRQIPELGESDSEIDSESEFEVYALDSSEYDSGAELPSSDLITSTDVETTSDTSSGDWDGSDTDTSSHGDSVSDGFED